jgi:chromosomal replication initiation ATPase DnaA
LAAELVSGRFEVPATQIVARRRGSRRVARARQAAMYLAHVAMGVPVAAVGRAFRRDRTTVSYACHRVEDRRDDPGFDAALSDLELTARSALESYLPRNPA